MLRPLLFLLLAACVRAEDPAPAPVPLRIVAANLTSGRHQTYSPDNGNHSNPEGAGARILKGLKPDVVLIQEFNTTIPARQWVNTTFGPEYSFFREEQEDVPNFIPNGIISRHPIVESGEWDDPMQQNRDFAWAKIRLPNGKNLWAISIHFYSQRSAIRQKEALELLRKIREIPSEDLVVLGGDFNTDSRNEDCMTVLEGFFRVDARSPADQDGNEGTNASRRRPYDWVLADAELEAHAAPVTIGAQEFPGGLVFDSRVFMPLADVPPVQPGDSAAPNMQHMAVIRDFLIP